MRVRPRLPYRRDQKARATRKANPKARGEEARLSAVEVVAERVAAERVDAAGPSGNLVKSFCRKDPVKTPMARVSRIAKDDG